VRKNAENGHINDENETICANFKLNIFRLYNIPAYCSKNLQNCVTYGTSDLSEQDVWTYYYSLQCERERGTDRSLVTTIASTVINSRNSRYFRVRSMIHSTRPIAWQLNIAAWFQQLMQMPTFNIYQ